MIIVVDTCCIGAFKKGQKFSYIAKAHEVIIPNTVFQEMGNPQTVQFKVEKVAVITNDKFSRTNDLNEITLKNSFKSYFTLLKSAYSANSFNKNLNDIKIGAFAFSIGADFFVTNDNLFFTKMQALAISQNLKTQVIKFIEVPSYFPGEPPKSEVK